MADILTPPAPGMAAAGAERPKPGGKGKTCDSVTIRRAGNGFIVEKSYDGGGPMEKPDVAPTLEDAFELGYVALGGAPPAAAEAPPGEPGAPGAPMPPAGPDAMAGAPEESGMPPMPAGAPPESPGIRYDEGGPTPEPEDEKY